MRGCPGALLAMDPHADFRSSCPSSTCHARDCQDHCTTAPSAFFPLLSDAAPRPLSAFKCLHSPQSISADILFPFLIFHHPAVLPAPRLFLFSHPLQSFIFLAHDPHSSSHRFAFSNLITFSLLFSCLHITIFISSFHFFKFLSHFLFIFFSACLRRPFFQYFFSGSPRLHLFPFSSSMQIISPGLFSLPRSLVCMCLRRGPCPRCRWLRLQAGSFSL